MSNIQSSPPQVTMSDKSAAERACKDPNPVIDGRKANVNLAYIGAKPRVMQATGKYSLFILVKLILIPQISRLKIKLQCTDVYPEMSFIFFI